ncbi:hypothetical protein M3Y98_00744800 [Aphelenchoides besseyi]|nr:hypothetical protein M3Y98_00744800 [Aphelenchoides besseyi]
MKSTSLIPKVKKKENANLPLKFESLFRQFESLELVMATNGRRGNFKTVAEIEKLMRKTAAGKFDMKLFGQILFLYPTSYSVKWTEGKTTRKAAAAQWIMSLRANLTEDLNGYVVLTPTCEPTAPYMSSPTKLISPVKGQRKPENLDYIPKSPTKSPVKPLMRVATSAAGPRLDVERQKLRNAIFKFLIFDFIRQKHADYVEQLGIEWTSEDYYVDFDPNEYEVPEAEIPKQPKKLVQRSIHEFLLTDPPKEQTPPPKKPLGPRAMAAQAAQDARAAQAAPIKSPPKSIVPATPKSRQRLQFERIKEKELKLKEEQAKIDPQAQRRRELLEHLEKRVFPVLQHEYLKNDSRSLTHLFKELKKSIPSLLRHDFTEMANLLADISPAHFEFQTVKTTQYLKLVDRDFNKVAASISAELIRF